jgi:hypothetical protein
LSNEEHFDNDHLEDCEYRYSLINNIVQHTANESINTKFNEKDIHLPIGKLNCIMLLNKLTMLGTILSAAYLKCSAVSVHPSEVLPVFSFPIER